MANRSSDLVSQADRLKTLQEAVAWVLNDMGYKAPEQCYGCVRHSWHPRLLSALKESQRE